MSDKSRASMAQAAAARTSALLLTILTAYLALVALTLLAVWQAPRETVPLDPEQQGPVFAAMAGHAVALALVGIATFLVRRVRRFPAAVPKLIVLIVVLTGVVSLDRIVGIVFPPPLPSRTIFALHPARGWTHRADSMAPFADTLMRIDHRGLRVPEDEPPAAIEDKTRVLFVGDSVTQGYYYPARDAYGWQAVALLNERHPGADLVCLNAGICGYDSRQETHWLIHEGLRLDPHLVVLQFCLNDLTTQYDPGGGMDQDRHPLFAFAARPTSRSGFRRAAQAIAMRLRFGKDLQAAAERIEHFQIAEVLSDEPPEHVERAWRTALGQLDMFVETCRTAGVPLLLVCFPIKDQLEDPAASDAPQRRLAAFAGRKMVEYLDLLPTFRDAMGGKPLAASSLFADTTHPTVLGHRVAAEATAAAIEASDPWRSLLARSRSRTGTSHGPSPGR